MAMTNPQYINVDGIKTRYFEAGQGPSLVLFHGGNMGSGNLCECAEDWELNFMELSRHCHVIAVDKLGQGYTDNPLKNNEFTMNATVSHAFDFLTALGLRSIHVAGHSRGGYLVCRLALDHADLIASCTIVDTNTLAPGTPRSAQVLAHPPEPRLSRESQRWIIEHYSHNPTHITKSWLDAVSEVAALSKSIEAHQKMTIGGLSKKQFMPRLAEDRSRIFSDLRDKGIKCPTLVMWGKDDPTAVLAQGEIIYDLIAAHQPRTEMAVLNHAGHFCFREQPQAFNARLMGFINSIAV
ncbi:MAG: alpha/beta fold hydrolase [Alphaproteobacteria bacterium]|nr:alpha/beta fold hydrolase [Alphaproteobacteria bacterium]